MSLARQRQEDFTHLLARFCLEHEPANKCEIVLVERIAQHFWHKGAHPALTAFTLA